MNPEWTKQYVHVAESDRFNIGHVGLCINVMYAAMHGEAKNQHVNLEPNQPIVAICIYDLEC